MGKTTNTKRKRRY